jgi:hypothetical protein
MAVSSQDEDEPCALTHSLAVLYEDMPAILGLEPLEWLKPPPPHLWKILGPRTFVMARTFVPDKLPQFKDNSRKIAVP